MAFWDSVLSEDVKSNFELHDPIKQKDRVRFVTESDRSMHVLHKRVKSDPNRLRMIVCDSGYLLPLDDVDSNPDDFFILNSSNNRMKAGKLEKFEGLIEKTTVFGGSVTSADKLLEANWYVATHADLMMRVRFEFKSEATQHLRRRCVTASDCNVLHFYNSRAQLNALYRSKLGLTEYSTNPAMEHGLRYEAEALEVYSQVTTNTVIKDIGFLLGANTEAPTWIGCTPDAVSIDEPVLVEVKCPYFRRTKTHEPTGLIDPRYYAQLQCQMAVTGIFTIDLVRYIPPSLSDAGEIKITRTYYDHEWWTRFVADVLTPFKRRLDEMQDNPELVPPPPKKRPKKSSPTSASNKRQCLIVEDLPHSPVVCSSEASTETLSPCQAITSPLSFSTPYRDDISCDGLLSPIPCSTLQSSTTESLSLTP